LFDEAGVVLVANPPAGEGELLARAVRQQFFVDELTAVVRVDPQYGKREQPTRPLQCMHDAVLGSVQKRQALRPGRGDVGQREGVQECALQAAPTVGDQVAFKKAWLDVVPFGERTYRDLLLEQAPGLRGREPMR